MNTIKETGPVVDQGLVLSTYTLQFDIRCNFYALHILYVSALYALYVHVSEMYKRLILLVKFYKSKVTYLKSIFGNFI